MELLVLSSMTLVGRYFASKDYRLANRSFKISDLPQPLFHELVEFALPACPDKVIYRIHAFEPGVPAPSSQAPLCFLGCPECNGLEPPNPFDPFVIPAGTYGRQGILPGLSGNTLELPEGYQKNARISFERLQMDENFERIQDIDFFCALQEK